MSAVVLNSGGFDSVVLLHYLQKIVGEKDLHSLHFLYGARNEVQQLKCVRHVCDKLNIPCKVIQVPAIDWTANDFYNSKEFVKEKQYLEYRNLIFLSYAVSYAEAIGANRVYCAFLNLWDYPDTTPEFVNGLNLALAQKDITIEAPFLFDGKDRLAHIATYLKITPEEYFSCDTPVGDKPCGVCGDCQSLREIFEKIK